MIHHQVRHPFYLKTWLLLMVLHSQGTKIIWWSVKHGSKYSIKSMNYHLSQMVFPSVSNEIYWIEPLPYLICIPKKKNEIWDKKEKLMTCVNHPTMALTICTFSWVTVLLYQSICGIMDFVFPLWQATYACVVPSLS